MRIVEEGEHPVILFVFQGIVFVIVALRALDRNSEHALSDSVHAIEHRLHPELLRIDTAFLIDHRVSEKARGDALILSCIRQTDRLQSARSQTDRSACLH